ncbi:MAG: 5'/3'-nucleotidase SurE [Candidatus Bruticola sp.]
MHILITNDDGIDAPGIKALIAEFASIENTKITVVAPHLQRSASSHSLTFHDPLRIYRQWEEGNVRQFAASGTPTDCVMLGLYKLCGEKPDFLLTGINRGANMGYDISYSATVSSALEGIVMGVPSLAVSLVGRRPQRYDMAAKWAHRLFDKWNSAIHADTEEGRSAFYVPSHSILSMNVPDIPEEEIKGLRFTRQGRSIYHQGVDKFIDPWGGEYYWIKGEVPQGELIEGTDFQAVHDGYVSVTPVQMSFTDTDTLTRLQQSCPNF